MKKALLIGINYTNTDNELNGCINDCIHMKELLIQSFGYDETNIICLTDDTDDKPTKHNILHEFNKLVDNVDKDDTLCFFYSGHGTQIKDDENDEISGFDDAIYTLDKQVIIDDDILDILTKLNGAHITLFFDCCHSGTMCDLQYNMRYKGKLTKQHFEIWTEKSKSINGSVCMFSGCLDKQVSLDISFQGKKTIENDGAFTFMLLECIKEQHHNITNKDLLINLHNHLKKNKFEQIPQFSCNSSNLFDSQFFI